MNTFALQLIKQNLSTPKTKQQLMQMTKLPERTLRYNIQKLKSQGMITEIFVLSDLRRKMYNLKKEV